MAIENLPVRVASNRAGEPEWFAQLSQRAWAVPTTNPYGYPIESAAGGEVFFKGVVGRVSKNGFDPCYPEQEIAFFSGCCAGAFYRQEVVPVIRWPFLKQPQYHNFRWIARGVGAITVWSENVGQNKWRIDDAPGVGGGVLSAHYIMPDGGAGDPEGPYTVFPGMKAPYARTAVTLDNRPVQHKWLGAEGKFCPIVQAPPT